MRDATSCSSATRAAISERWQASGSRSTQKRAARPVRGKRVYDRLDSDRVEDLGGVARHVLRSELDARALADARAGVLGVLELTQLRGRRELLHVPVVDPGIVERGL